MLLLDQLLLSKIGIKGTLIKKEIITRYPDDSFSSIKVSFEMFPLDFLSCSRISLRRRRELVKVEDIVFWDNLKFERLWKSTFISIKLKLKIAYCDFKKLDSSHIISLLYYFLNTSLIFIISMQFEREDFFNLKRLKFIGLNKRFRHLNTLNG